MFTVTPNGTINGVLNIIGYNSNGKVVTPTQTSGAVAYIHSQRHRFVYAANRHYGFRHIQRS